MPFVGLNKKWLKRKKEKQLLLPPPLIRLFLFSQLVSDSFKVLEKCARSVIKCAYADWDGVHKKKKKKRPSLWLSLFHLVVDFHLKHNMVLIDAQKRQQLLRQHFNPPSPTKRHDDSEPPPPSVFMGWNHHNLPSSYTVQHLASKLLLHNHRQRRNSKSL